MITSGVADYWGGICRLGPTKFISSWFNFNVLNSISFSSDLGSILITGTWSYPSLGFLLRCGFFATNCKFCFHVDNNRAHLCYLEIWRLCTMNYHYALCTRWHSVTVSMTVRMEWRRCNSLVFDSRWLPVHKVDLYCREKSWTSFLYCRGQGHVLIIIYMYCRQYLMR